MRAVALVMSLSILGGGCFPHEPQKRFYAQLGEGGATVGGILILALAKTGADCDKETGAMAAGDCRSSASLVGNLGLGLLVAGLVGFIATISTAEDDDKPAPKPTPIATDPPAHQPKPTPIAPTPVTPAPAAPAPAP